MVSTIEDKKTGVRWTDVHSTSPEDIVGAIEGVVAHPLILRELVRPTFSAKVDVYEDMLYVILHFPVADQEHQIIKVHEIDVVIKKNTLITVHYDAIAPLQDFFSALKQSKENSGPLGEHAGFVFFELLHKLYAHVIKELEHIERQIIDVEDCIFQHKEKEMVRFISLLRRDILDFRRALELHGHILSSLERTGVKFFGKNFAPYLADIFNAFLRVRGLLDNNFATISALQETNDSVLAARNNEVMKNLTIVALVTFPLMLLSSIFSMNTTLLPIVGNPNDFWIIIAIMVAGTVGMLILFKKKRWF